MQSILTADNDTLYKCLNEIDDRFKDMHISAYETDYLLKLQKQIKIELNLRSANMHYHQCTHRTKDGNCLVIGGFCTANSDGNALDMCQEHRKKLIDKTSKDEK